MTPAIPELHAQLSAPDGLLRARRALCRMALRLLVADDDSTLLNECIRSPELLDSPLLRHAVHQALAAGGGPPRCDVPSLGTLAAGPHRLTAAGFSVAVVSHPDADRLLADVLRTLGGGADRMSLLTAAGEPRFSQDLSCLTAGMQLAVSASAEMVRDLLPHVSLVAFLDEAAGVQSASMREFPGLILVARPRSPLAAAEMLVHEAAHQKFFDLALVHDLLDTDSDRCPPFTPPWRTPGTRWPIEQSLAALHTYACLAQFARDIDGSVGPQPLGDRSLLPAAEKRIALLGGWLLAHSTYLAPDARFLVDGLLGREPAAAPAQAEASSTLDGGRVRVDPTLRIDLDAAPGRVLVARSARPYDFYFLDADSGLLLDLLRDRQPAAAVSAFAGRRHLDRSQAERLVASILPKLAAADLVSIDATM